MNLLVEASLVSIALLTQLGLVVSDQACTSNRNLVRLLYILFLKMIIIRFISFVPKSTRAALLIHPLTYWPLHLNINYAYTYNKFHKKSLKPITNTPPLSIKEKSMQIYQSQQDIDLANSISSLPLKQFSLKIHYYLLKKQKSDIFWSTIESEFLQRISPTADQTTIRSYSKILYSLSKSKKACGHYQTKMSLLLPFATPQSFASIVTAVSRISPFSQQFGYIVEVLYYKRKAEFRTREIIAINYSLANNSRKCDSALIDFIDSFNAVETITMLRCYDKSQLITKEILRIGLTKLKAVQRQLNVLDLADLISIYLKHEYIPSQLETMLQESYSILKKHINDICLQKIWESVPKCVNKGYLKVKLVEEMITTIQILRKGKNMSEVIWRKIQPSFQEFRNIQLRLRLEKIY